MLSSWLLLQASLTSQSSSLSSSSSNSSWSIELLYNQLLKHICITQMYYHAHSFSLDYSWLYFTYCSSFSSASLWWLSDRRWCFSIWWVVYKESFNLHFVWYKEFSDFHFISLHDFYLQLTATWLIDWTFCDFD